MRKILILIVLILMIFLSYTVIVSGLSLGSKTLTNYKDLEEKSSQLNVALQNLNTQNTSQYESKKLALLSAVRNYKEKKEQYETILPEIEASKEEEDNSNPVAPVDLYDVGFLWTIIGNYASEEGIALDLNFVKDNTSTSVSTDFLFCDLKFTVSGDYITITDFIYDLEDDDRLNFEISDFQLAKGGSNLQSTFVVKSVPLNNKNLSNIATNTEDTTNTVNPDANSTVTDTNVVNPAGDTNTVSPTNTVSSTTNTAGTNTTTNTITQ